MTIVLDAFRLDGKTVIVTGASRGLGRATAIAFAKAGADVALAAGDAEALGETAAIAQRAGRQALARTVDVTPPDTVDDLLRDVVGGFGAVDVLVNCAGVQRQTPAAETEVREWQAVRSRRASSARTCLPGSSQTRGASSGSGGGSPCAGSRGRRSFVTGAVLCVDGGYRAQ